MVQLTIWNALFLKMDFWLDGLSSLGSIGEERAYRPSNWARLLLYGENFHYVICIPHLI